MRIYKLLINLEDCVNDCNKGGACENGRCNCDDYHLGQFCEKST